MDVKFNVTIVAKKADGSDYVIEESRPAHMSDERIWEKVKNIKVGDGCREELKKIIKNSGPKYKPYSEKMVTDGYTHHSIEMRGCFVQLKDEIVRGSWSDLIKMYSSTHPNEKEMNVYVKLIFDPPMKPSSNNSTLLTNVSSIVNMSSIVNLSSM